MKALKLFVNHIETTLNRTIYVFTKVQDMKVIQYIEKDCTVMLLRKDLVKDAR